MYVVFQKFLPKKNHIQILFAFKSRLLKKNIVKMLMDLWVVLKCIFLNMIYIELFMFDVTVN